ncbi:hypothetical protein [Priestia megaterium]
MKLNQIEQLIVDLINEYDEGGYVLSEVILEKYEKKIIELMIQNTEE